MDIGGEVLDDINNFGDVTILAPSNEAWNASSIDNIIRFVCADLVLQSIKKLRLMKRPFNVNML